MAAKKFLDYDGLQHLVTKLDARYADIQAIVFKGVKANIAALPAVSTQKIGYMYNITTGGTTTADFLEGAGKTLQDGENVVCIELISYSEVTPVGTENPKDEGWYEESTPAGTYVLTADTTVTSGKKYYEEVKTNKWDIVGGVFNINDRLQFGKTMPTSPTNGQVFLYMGDTVYNYDAVTTVVGTDNPSVKGWYEAGQTAGTYVLTADTEPKTVYRAYTDGTDIYYVVGTPSVGDTVYTITGGAAVDSGYTVSVIGAGTIEVNGTTYTASAMDDQYIDEKTYYTKGSEKYTTGVIYVYDSTTSSWKPESSASDMVPITNAEIDTLFD